MSSVNYTGWVPMRRGIIEHIRDRRLTSMEAVALMVLIMLADKSSGSYTINVPTLRHYVPSLSQGAADRTLRSLQTKGYIWRKITLKSPVAYPYWINGYEPTFGAYKGRRLDLSDVQSTGDIANLRYIRASDVSADGTVAQSADATADQGADAMIVEKPRKQTSFEQTSRVAADHGADVTADQGAGVTADQDADSNKKGETRSDNIQKTIPLVGKGDGGTIAHSIPSVRRPEQSSEASASNRAMAHDGDMVPNGSPRLPTKGARLRWSGEAGAYVDMDSGISVPLVKATERIRALGLVRDGDGFIDVATGSKIPWNPAQQIISGERMTA